MLKNGAWCFIMLSSWACYEHCVQRCCFVKKYWVRWGPKNGKLVSISAQFTILWNVSANFIKSVVIFVQLQRLIKANKLLVPIPRYEQFQCHCLSKYIFCSINDYFFLHLPYHDKVTCVKFYGIDPRCQFYKTLHV